MWTVKNYNAFLREAKADLGIGHRDAQALYREVRAAVGRNLYGRDVRRLGDVVAEAVGDVLAPKQPRLRARVQRPVTQRPERKRRGPKRRTVGPDVLPVGTELEITATTRGGTPRRRKGGR